VAVLEGTWGKQCALVASTMMICLLSMRPIVLKQIRYLSPAPARVGEVQVVGFNQEKKIDKD